MSSEEPIVVSFEHEGREIDESGVFDLLYSGLETLIDANRYRRKRSYGQGHTIGQTDYHRTRDPKDANQLYENWRRNLPTIEASASTPSGDIALKVKARDNFDILTIQKQPNIAFLEREDSDDILVLREARTYDPRLIDVISKQSRAVRRSFDRDATESFVRGEAEQAPDGYAYVPEPHLVRGLERLYDDGYPRITPYAMVLNDRGTKSWYLREHLKLVRDTSFDTDEFGQFLGRMHHLGLTEMLDRQMVHYAISQDGQGVVTYDPDFMLITKRRDRITHLDLSDAESMLRHNDRGSLYGPIKRARREELERLSTDHPNAQRTLIDYAQSF